VARVSCNRTPVYVFTVAPESSKGRSASWYIVSFADVVMR